MSLSEKIDIVEKVKFKWVPQAEVAREFRVSKATISALMAKVRKNPKYIRELADHKYYRDKGRQEVQDFI